MVLKTQQSSRFYKMYKSTFTSLWELYGYVVRSNHRYKDTLLYIISLLRETLLQIDIEDMSCSNELAKAAVYFLSIQTEILRIKQIANS